MSYRADLPGRPKDCIYSDCALFDPDEEACGLLSTTSQLFSAGVHLRNIDTRLKEIMEELRK